MEAFANPRGDGEQQTAELLIAAAQALEMLRHAGEELSEPQAFAFVEPGPSHPDIVSETFVFFSPFFGHDRWEPPFHPTRRR